MKFEEWYEHLRELMKAQLSSEGIPLDPDFWCELSVWRAHYDFELSPEQAFLSER